jgi:2-polyprenyl-6-methoxyphenol hydroxylase-like FAD-dependent oxidoreductase
LYRQRDNPFPDGREERASADWLAGCDGAHSLVRHTVGATFAGQTMGGAMRLYFI